MSQTIISRFVSQSDAGGLPAPSVSKSAGDDDLKGSKRLWLFNSEDLCEDRWIEFDVLND